MDAERYARQLERGIERIEALVRGVADDQARWKPDPASWSILEVMGHLADEERLDFRVRLDHTLHRPGTPWPPIDPEGWVTERHYNEGDLDETVGRFVDARADSVRWLRTLGTPAWDAAHTAPFGSLRAGDLMAAWVGHDLLHMRQIVRLHWQYLSQEAAPYRPAYAGRW
jgi:hypothetical protein